TSGGNPKDNARADEQSWEGVLKFLDTAVKARGQAAPSANRAEAGAAATPNPARHSNCAARFLKLIAVLPGIGPLRQRLMTSLSSMTMR
ncbi:hypothetical protein SB758_33180, partial [Burkholderia sp. SIMBA_013]